MVFTNILQKLFGTSNEKIIASYQKKVDQINDFEPLIQALSDNELKAKTDEFKQRLKQNESLDDILPEVFAVVRETAKRLLGMRHFDVQLIGGIILHEGKIAEMKTGEGKTLVATLPAYLNALEGKGVYMVSVNDYLVKRDSEWMGKIYRFLGLSVGLIQANMPPQDRLNAYQCDITFGTNNEYGFDYLRDHLSSDISQCCQLRKHYAIIDEVDSILIDEARTPLIISGPVKDSTKKYINISKIAKSLKIDTHFNVDEKHKNVVLTEEGIDVIEKELGLSTMYSVKNMDAAHMAVQCLKALHIFKRDTDYVIKDGEIIIVDEFTGRLMEGRRYSDGLHQAIEAIENVTIREESQTLASVTFQNYFRMFPKLAGMTGTALTEAEEFENIYGLSVIPVPTNKPLCRNDQADVIYKNKQGKYHAIVDRIAELHKKNQPVLVGTIAIETSELFSNLLKKRGIPHHVLNAKHHEREAEIIAKAGQKGAVTIATNMAGRGTDIVLGEGVSDLGGLYVIGSERHESRRIDNQLRGRSGRQGDPGATQFFVSLEDDLMRLFGSDRIKNVMEALGMPDDMPIEHKMISRSLEKAQQKVEKYHFGMRKQVLQYDNVVNKQRETIYKFRDNLLQDHRIDEIYKELLDTYITELTEEFSGESLKNTDSKQAFELQIKQLLPISNSDELIKKYEKNPEKQLLIEATLAFYDHRKSEYPETLFEKVITKRILLMTLDKKWMEHLHNMDVLREGIGLRAYGQRDPLLEYKKEAYTMYKELMLNVAEEALVMIHRSVIVTENQDEPKDDPKITESSSDQPNDLKKIKRNDKVTLQKNGEKKEAKWKVAEDLIAHEGWELAQENDR
jgi:preprotein translocase subunit SecA